MIKKPQQTAQRAAILSYLKENAFHPSISDVYEAVSKKLPDMSLTTVYNTVNFLKKQGMIKELPMSDGTGKRFDPNTSPHDHLICSVCKTIVDIDLPHSVEIPEAERRGFDILGMSINIYGLCPRCKSMNREPEVLRKPKKRKAASGNVEVQ